MFLGVDGGGTKTALALVTPSGAIVARAEVGGSYYLGKDSAGGAGEEAVGVDRVRSTLRAGVAAVSASAGIGPEDIAFAFFGLTGYGEVAADQPVLDAVPREILGHDRCRSGNDMICGWAGSLGGEDGINVIAGTGSIAYGRRGDREARTGGWSEVFGDEGSGYWIGVRSLGLFSRMSDGRRSPGPLLDLVRRDLDLERDLDLVDVVLQRWGGDRRRIAALAPLVGRAAEQGDAQAAEILAAAGEELAELAGATRRALMAEKGGALGEGHPGEDAGNVSVVSYSGGVFRSPPVRASFVRALAGAGGYDVRPPRFAPDLGAALFAAQLAGRPIESVARVRLAEEATLRGLSPSIGSSPIGDDSRSP